MKQFFAHFKAIKAKRHKLYMLFVVTALLLPFQNCGRITSTSLPANNNSSGTPGDNEPDPQYTYSWMYGSWSSCSVPSCQMQSRSATCTRNDSVAVADNLCSEAPLISQACALSACGACALPASLGGGTLGNGQTIQAFQNSMVPQGQTCAAEMRLCTNGTLSGSYQYASCTVQTVPPQTNNGIVVDFSYVDRNSQAYTRFKNMVDAVVAGGSRPYAFSGVDAAYMYGMTQQAQYCTLAVRIAEEQVAAAEAAIAGGGRPDVSGDSYLEVGPMISEVAYAYDWCYSNLTAAQRSRWEAYANQAIYNVWNHTTASWGGRSYPWSGWSVNNPGNNYYYSFVNATMLWALATNNQTYLDLLKNNKMPALVSYYSQLAGGGSREGTGYGTAHSNLFSVYQVWRDSTGQDIANASTHVSDTIRYWVHATVPTRQRFAPIGDQARDSSAELFDYHRALVLKARTLSNSTSLKNLASWWLNHISVDRMTHAFNYRDDLHAAGTSGALPTENLIHHGVGTGHLFARSSWETNATWLSLVAGPYSESHAHQDQGAFSLYKNAWLAVTPNILSHSGINQTTDIHNVVRFVRNGTIIRQVSHDNITPANTSTMSITSRNDATGELSAEMNLTPAYNNNAAIQSWRRNVQFVNDNGARVLNVQDNFQVTADTQAIFQLHTITQPSVSGNTVTVNGMTMTVLAPANPQISVVSLANGEFSGGYRVEIRGSQTEYRVQIRVP